MPSTDLGAQAPAATQSASLTSLLGMSEHTGISKVEYVIGGQQLSLGELYAEIVANLRTDCCAEPVSTVLATRSLCQLSWQAGAN